jgi:hypothetical protein
MNPGVDDASETEIPGGVYAVDCTQMGWRYAGTQNIIEDRNKQEGAEVVEKTYGREQQDSRDPLDGVRQTVANEAKEFLHAGPPVCR